MPEGSNNEVSEHRVPGRYPDRESVRAGGLMSSATSVLAMGHRAATVGEKILNGATPAELPVEQPTTFELVINLKTAEPLSLTIPPGLPFQADEVLR